MKFLFYILALLMFISSPGVCAEQVLMHWPCYEVGMQVPILFEYEGDVAGWDGGIYPTGLLDPERLGVFNSCFLSVSLGLNEFKKPVPPIGKGPANISLCVALNGHFETLVDLRKHFNLSTPGVYTVEWGCRGVCDTEIMFEIISSGAVKRAEDMARKKFEEKMKPNTYEDSSCQ